jgi:hypothetical protein
LEKLPNKCDAFQLAEESPPPGRGLRDRSSLGGGSYGRRFILAARRPSAPFDRGCLGCCNFRHPGRGSPPATAAPTRQFLKANDRFLDLLPFIPKFLKDLADIHLCFPPSLLRRCINRAGNLGGTLLISVYISIFALVVAIFNKPMEFET